MSCKIRKDRIINEDIRENLTVEPSEDKIERTIWDGLSMYIKHQKLEVRKSDIL